MSLEYIERLIENTKNEWNSRLLAAQAAINREQRTNEEKQELQRELDKYILTYERALASMEEHRDHLLRNND